MAATVLSVQLTQNQSCQVTNETAQTGESQQCFSEKSRHVHSPGMRAVSAASQVPTNRHR